MSRSFALVVLLVLSATAFGQMMPLGNTARLVLVMQPDVKKELKISKDQDKQIQGILKDLQRDGAAGLMSGQFNMMNPMAGMDPKLEPILNDGQNLRLQGLYIQANGGFALTDPKVAAAVALTDDQKLQVETIDAEATKVSQDMMMKARSNAALKALKEKRKEFGERIRAVLTPEQMVVFVALQGKPFKFKG